MVEDGGGRGGHVSIHHEELEKAPMKVGYTGRGFSRLVYKTGVLQAARCGRILSVSCYKGDDDCCEIQESCVGFIDRLAGSAVVSGVRWYA